MSDLFEVCISLGRYIVYVLEHICVHFISNEYHFKSLSIELSISDISSSKTFLNS